MQTVNVRGALRADGSIQVCLWATLPGMGEVFVVSGQVITLPLTTDVTDAIAQGRLMVLPEEAELDRRTVVDRVVDVTGAAPAADAASVKRGRK